MLAEDLISLLEEHRGKHVVLNIDFWNCEDGGSGFEDSISSDEISNVGTVYVPTDKEVLVVIDAKRGL